MPVYKLSKELVFPHPSLADEDGALAIGGDLSVERLLLAYEYGIFPWYSEGQPIIWWSPDPRFVLFPQKVVITKSMKKFLKKNLFHITYNKCFASVINMCKNIRESTWITDEMMAAYIRLNKLGFACSVETWYGDELVGGLYGVSIGKCFFGESMFSKMNNASKTALIDLANKLTAQGFLIIDCQQETEHLRSLGAESISRDEFLKVIQKGIIS